MSQTRGVSEVHPEEEPSESVRPGCDGNGSLAHSVQTPMDNLEGSQPRGVSEIQAQQVPSQTVRPAQGSDGDITLVHSIDPLTESSEATQPVEVAEIDIEDENVPAVRISHEPEHLSEQGMEKSNLQNIIVTAEEDVSVELYSSPRRGVEQSEHVASPRKRDLLQQSIVVKQVPLKIEPKISPKEWPRTGIQF